MRTGQEHAAIKRVRDVMTPSPRTVPAGCSLQEAAGLMRSWDIREVFVVDHGTFCGVLVDSDIIVMAIASGRSPSEITAGECYSPNAPRLDASQFLATALAYMRRHGVDRVAVVEGDQLVGGVWLSDLEHAVVPGARPDTPSPDRMSSS